MDYTYQEYTYDLWLPNLQYERYRFADLKRRPPERGVYILCHSVGVSYVGQSTTGYRRIFAHDHPMQYFFWLPLHVALLDQFEKAAIRFFRPQFNFAIRDICAKRNDSVLEIPKFLEESCYSDLKGSASVRRITVD